MTSIADGSVNIQTTPEPNPSTPSWFGEVVLISRYLGKHDVLTKISERVDYEYKRRGTRNVFVMVQLLAG